jgi:hypothetical protein
MVRVAPLVVMAAVADASPQAAVQQVAVVVPRQAVKEAASLAVPAPLQPRARANKRVSFLMTMRYHPTRRSLCRTACDNFPALG